MRTDDSVEPPVPLVPHHPSPIGVSTETHADGELRNSHKERRCGETQVHSQHPKELKYVKGNTSLTSHSRHS